MLPISQRYGYTNYITGLGQSINTQGLLISKTNSLNINLLSVHNKPNPFLSNVKVEDWSKVINRVYSFLTPFHTTKNISFECKSEELLPKKMF